MHKFRSTWLALIGGAFLVTLSISAAFGADPDEIDGNRGQTIAAFVHSLVFAHDDETDETVDEDQDEDTEEDPRRMPTRPMRPTDADRPIGRRGDTAEDSEAREVPEFANHGECVSDAAHDTEGFEESDAANHGEWVSENARYTCWGLDVPDEEESDEAAVDEDADTEVTSAEARAAARAERAEARAAARAARAEAREAAKAARTEVRAAGHTNRGNGGGHGKP